MKYRKLLAICAVLVLGVAMQPEAASANQITEIAAEGGQDGQSQTAETPMEDGQDGQPQTGETTSGDGQGEQPQTEEPLENDEQPEEVPLPKKVTGLHTTCQSDQKVLLEWDACDGAVYYEIYRKKADGNYKKLDEVTDEYYVDETIAYGATYTYKVIPVNHNDEEGPAAVIKLENTLAVNLIKQKYTYHQMQLDMRELERKYSDYCTLTTIGTSVQGRMIYDFAIGDPNAKESLLVVSTLHAREYICSAILMRELEYYLRGYHSRLGGVRPADVLKNMQIHYVVMSNPDGVTISQNSYPRWKSNARGVDLNNNFPAKPFIVGGKKGASGYSGTKALSEPESQAIASLTKKLKKNQHLLGVINYHAMGQIVFGSCSDKNLKKDTQTMYLIARKLTGYQDSGSYSSGKRSSGGSYREYVMDLLQIPSITIEVGSTYAPCSYGEYASAFEKNKLVVLKIAKAL